MAVVGVFAVLAAGAPLLNLPDPITQDLSGRLLSPSRLHWLGTDDLGRDLLSRIIYGGPTSPTVGIVSVRLALATSPLLGLVGGIFRGLAGTLAMRLVELVLGCTAPLLGNFNA